ncbi:hypothetical protein [Pseudomonas sp. ACN5]|uniref:hypothetical protein n=1 Tax=Pseudomonas sp. ACN5 TaxID=1920427 RepID=UPI0021150A7D|nr:hypothetical protein [Pseudomonas sp. ACN5]
MKKRKPNNLRTRVERASRALLNANHVAVVHIEPSGRQGMINRKSCKSIPPGQHMAEAVCDFAHRWTIYVSVQCRDQRGHRYTKSVEVAPQGDPTGQGSRQSQAQVGGARSQGNTTGLADYEGDL